MAKNIMKKVTQRLSVKRAPGVKNERGHLPFDDLFHFSREGARS